MEIFDCKSSFTTGGTEVSFSNSSSAATSFVPPLGCCFELYSFVGLVTNIFYQFQFQNQRSCQKQTYQLLSAKNEPQ